MIHITARWMENYVEINFPCSEEDLTEAIKDLRSVDTSPEGIFLLSMHRPEQLKLLEDRFVDLDELNYLAKRMDGMSHGELTQFYAGATYEKYTNLKDLINLTFNLPRYTVIQDMSDLAAVGKHHYLSKNQVMTPDEQRATDFAKIGRDLMQSGKGIVTQHGILFKNEDVPYEEVYDGSTFPQYNYYGGELLTVEAEHAGRIETLYLPCEDLAITKAMYRLGCESVDEIDFTIADTSFDNPTWFMRLQKLMPYIGIYQMNEVAGALNYATIDLTKLNAVMQYADRADAPAIIALAERLDNFRFLPGANDMEEVGRYFVERDNDYYLHDDLQDYFDYDGFGNHMAELYDGKFVDAGYVCMDQDCYLENVLRGTEDQAVSFGGM